MLRQGYYARKTTSEIAFALCSEGTPPRHVSEHPGSYYDTYTNPQGILMAFLDGSVEITLVASLPITAISTALPSARKLPWLLVLSPDKLTEQDTVLLRYI